MYYLARWPTPVALVITTALFALSVTTTAWSVSNGSLAGIILNGTMTIWLGSAVAAGLYHRRQHRDLSRLRRTTLTLLARLQPGAFYVPSAKAVFRLVRFSRGGITASWMVGVWTPIDDAASWQTLFDPDTPSWIETFTIWRLSELVAYRKDIMQAKPIDLPTGERKRRRKELDKHKLSYADANDLRRLVWLLEGAQSIPTQ